MSRSGVDGKGRIGERIRDLRTGRGMSLAELGRRTGLSPRFLSRLEKSRVPAAIDALDRIAEALNVDIGGLSPPPGRESRIITRSCARPFIRNGPDGRVIHYMLTGDIRPRKLLPRIVEILPGDRTEEEPAPYLHDGEELIFVLEGILTLSLSGKVYRLNPGDCAHFSPGQPHGWANPTGGRVRFLVVNTRNPGEGSRGPNDKGAK